MSDNTKSKKPFYKRKLLWLAAVILLIIIAANSGGDKKTASTAPANNTSNAAAAPTPAPQPKFDAQAAYDKVEAGQTRADAEAVIGISPSNCTESTTAGYGTTAYCTYQKGFSSSSLSVVYFNGAVQSKNITKL